MNKANSYIVGFVLSMILTLASFSLVMNHLLNPGSLLIIILVLAFAQLIIQLIFFLHLAGEKGPRWKLIFFVSTISVVLIVVVGSIWIMDNLNTRMTPQEMNNYTINQDGL